MKAASFQPMSYSYLMTNPKVISFISTDRRKRSMLSTKLAIYFNFDNYPIYIAKNVMFKFNKFEFFREFKLKLNTYVQ